MRTSAPGDSGLSIPSDREDVYRTAAATLHRLIELDIHIQVGYCACQLEQQGGPLRLCLGAVGGLAKPLVHLARRDITSLADDADRGCYASSARTPVFRRLLFHNCILVVRAKHHRLLRDRTCKCRCLLHCTAYRLCK